MKPTTAAAYKLMHDGAIAHAKIEAAGMKIDVARLDKTIERVGVRIDRLTEKLKTDEVWTAWRRRYGEKTNIGSRQQLGQVVFGDLGYKTTGTTKTGRPKMDSEALEQVDLPFVKRFLQVEKLKKLRSTNLKGVRREVVDSFLHPSFNLHLARTFRPSSDTPNFQNIPIRDKKIGKLIRSCFVPRPGHVLVEIDYGGHEFKVASCFWRDEKMMAYASDPDLDIHRDMAAECYSLEPEEVTSSVRFFAKNQFVFPTLYGSYYVNTASNLWGVIGTAGLTRKDGQSLEDHLLGLGITEDNFVDHIQDVEERFNAWFPTWSDRKEKWWARYQKRGWFPMMTGFRVAGIYSRNNLFNTPVQGPAFHCLLWSLIRLVRWLEKRKMRTVIIGQIHDSIVADVHRDELDEFLAKAKEIMTVDIRKAWPWVIVPFVVEAEIGEETWWEKKVVEI